MFSKLLLSNGLLLMALTNWLCEDGACSNEQEDEQRIYVEHVGCSVDSCPQEGTPLLLNVVLLTFTGHWAFFISDFCLYRDSSDLPTVYCDISS